MAYSLTEEDEVYIADVVAAALSAVEFTVSGIQAGLAYRGLSADTEPSDEYRITTDSWMEARGFEW